MPATGRTSALASSTRTVVGCKWSAGGCGGTGESIATTTFGGHGIARKFADFGLGRAQNSVEKAPGTARKPGAGTPAPGHVSGLQPGKTRFSNFAAPIC